MIAALLVTMVTQFNQTIDTNSVRTLFGEDSIATSFSLIKGTGTTVYYNDPEEVKKPGAFPSVHVYAKDGPFSLMSHHRNVSGKSLTYHIQFSVPLEVQTGVGVSINQMLAGELAAKESLISKYKVLTHFEVDVPNNQTIDVLVCSRAPYDFTVQTDMGGSYLLQHTQAVVDRSGNAFRTISLSVFDALVPKLYINTSPTESILGYGQNITEAEELSSRVFVQPDIVEGPVPGDYAAHRELILSNPSFMTTTFEVAIKQNKNIQGNHTFFLVGDKLVKGSPGSIEVPPLSSTKVNFIQQGGLDAAAILGVSITKCTSEVIERKTKSIESSLKKLNTSRRTVKINTGGSN